MKKKFLNPLLNRLFEEKEGLCISIILPLYKLSPHRQQNHALVKKAVEKAVTKLAGLKGQDKKADAIISTLQENIKKLAAKIDYVRPPRGMGMYISKNIAELVDFPFMVKEKIILSHTFQVRDLLFKEQLFSNYYVLALTIDSARLFTGSDAEHYEIKDENFPAHFRDDYIYAKPALGHPSYPQFLKSAEKDKSIVKQIRSADFYRKLDAKLSGYLQPKSPLIITGVAKALSTYLDITSHQKNIIAQISGNYPEKSLESFRIRCWKKARRHSQNQEALLLKEVENKLGTKGLAAGLENAWKAAAEGSVLQLLVEKDFSKEGYLDENESKLKTHSVRSGKSKYLPDAVDDLIEKTIEQGGEVIFVHNGALRIMQRVAAVKRY